MKQHTYSFTSYLSDIYTYIHLKSQNITRKIQRNLTYSYCPNFQAEDLSVIKDIHGQE